MSRVTGLTPAKRRPGWLEVELDGASAFQLPRRVAAEAGLEIGDRLAPREVAALRESADRRQAIQSALRYLSVRPRSRVETERQLRRQRLPDAAVAAAVQECVSRGLLDDTAFATAFATDRIRLGPRSIARIEVELGARGVAADVARAGIETALEGEAVTEAELLERAARKAWTRLRHQDREIARRRLYGYLNRRGFRGEEVRELVRSLLDEQG